MLRACKIQRKLGCDGVYGGPRGSQRRGGKLVEAARGTRRSGGEWRCCPLARWTADDVAYHIEHGIEINPCYFNSDSEAREIRVSWAVPTPGARAHGEMEHFRYYYPEQFRKLRDMEIY